MINSFHISIEKLLPFSAIIVVKEIVFDDQYHIDVCIRGDPCNYILI